MLTGAALIWSYVGAAFSLFMVVNLAYAIWLGRGQAVGGRAWASTEGEILTSRVDLKGPHTSDEDTDCVATVRYRYAVAGRTYEGERIRLGGRTSTTRRIAEQAVAKYPTGQLVSVFYDPRHPKNAVLERKNRTQPALYVFLVVFVAIATVLVVHSIAGKVLYAGNGVPLFAFLLPAAAIAIGLGGAVQFVALRRLKSASMRWPTVNGTIIRSEVVEEMREVHDNERTGIRRELRYRPAVRYSYHVGEKDFSGDVLQWGWSAIYSNSEQPRAIVAKYPNGVIVPVHYDPADPQNAVLEPGQGGGIAAPLIFAGLFIGVGALFLWFFLSVSML